MAPMRRASRLKSEIAPDLIEAYRGTGSLPSELLQRRRMAVKSGGVAGGREIECVEVAK